METFDERDLEKLYRPPKDSHKGMNGKLLVIGGSKLFHSSIFWAADVASRIVDLVHFSSPAMENNDLVRQKIKAGFWNGIVVPWERVEEYIEEEDAILIGPGMPREEGEQKGDVDTGETTNKLLRRFGDKKWVIDGGALQEMDVNLIPKKAILTPHRREWERLIEKSKFKSQNYNSKIKTLQEFAKEYHCTILLKGEEDMVCDKEKCVKVLGGNEGMTKGGTGDVLAGIVAGLYCKNEAFLSATVGSYINKKAGDELYQEMGPYFNASDLVVEVPKVMKEVLGY